ncbi:Trans-hexaprenyltranstransferase [Thermoanaerobacterium xylanolyticum LX-11]|uniref:Trans-hexaprenyltranstransferase n=1 Tax=Thermoanaerobacterium xylanolyticum (strain ATCC 49914 / DSM 7097 / LX-11) TaxID=858215 RepID=F6BHS9_THEXL|nr:polyprenyl synthetase family protein [Thermoanaerobacterium xylanolyticum]AEF17678.1 Trans-hexaprenyltranstransferase [Thermoanaerobacterium xylanolyticum LX-11]
MFDKYEFVKEDMKKIDEFILANVKTNSPTIKKAIDDLVLSGGKRIRPLLVIAIARMGEYSEEKIIPIAASIEIMHMATLIHDDIIDDSKMRRGQKSVQSKYGKETAVFTGDFLFSQAFNLIADIISKENLKLIAKGVKAICEGEIEQFDNRYNLDLSIKKYLKRIYRKTALLFAISCESGASQAGLPKEMIRAMRHFGLEIGTAFQIVDDILDYEGVERVVGKPLGSDLLNGIYTLPLIYALKTDRKKVIKGILRKRDLSRRDVNCIIKEVKLSGGIDYAKELALKYVKKAVKYLEVIPDCEQKSLMMDIADDVLKRNH